jgi:hypothetical protein
MRPETGRSRVELAGVKRLRFAAAAAMAVLAGSTAVVQAAPHAAAAPKAAAVVTNGSWPVYHHDNAHTGFDSTQPTASGATTGWVSPAMDGAVYASPVVYGGIVYAATLNNTVYAFNQADGSLLWSTHLGTPTSSGWTCGNVSPLGILGTPVIDTAAGRIYVAFFASDHLYRVDGLNLTTGAIALNTSIPTTIGSGFDWTIQQQRGALALANGNVYVPFGGRWGDCGSYHGWVVGVATNGSPTPIVYETPSTGSGVWAAGGVAIDDATGNVFFATGNHVPRSTCSSAVNSDSVIRTAPALGLATSFFQPQDWSANWCATDMDLGSAGPVLISPTLAFMSGKYGQGFLVDPTNLGGTNGQLFPAASPYAGADVCVGNHNDATFGSFAYAAPYVYLSCQSQGIVGLKVDTAAKTFSLCGATCAAPSWHSGAGKVYGPPIVAGGIVWAVDTSGSGLTGFDAATGTSVFQSGAFAARNFSTPSEAGGQVFVASDTVVREFNLVPACTNATLTPNPGSPQAAGTAVLLTATITNCASPLYKFWVQPPGGSWGVVQPYGAGNTYNWTSTGTAGLYHLEVDVKNSGSTAAYDSVANITYTINGAATCASAGLSTNPTSPQLAGTQVVLSASSTACPTPRYQFWLQDPGSRWSMVQDYSAGTTYTWAAANNRTPGVYHLQVYARDASESVTYDAVSPVANYQMNAVAGCTAANLSASPPSPGATGATVTLTGSSASCPNPRYRFWILDPGRSWSMVQDYSAATTYTWTQTGLAGSYRTEVDVRDASETTVYDVVFNLTYQVSGCTAAALVASPANTAAHGTTITFTGSATCLGTPTYKFWIKAPGGAWSVVQSYGTSNTFSWTSASSPINTSAAGTYSIEVDIRNQGGTDTYETVKGITYVLS